MTKVFEHFFHLFIWDTLLILRVRLCPVPSSRLKDTILRQGSSDRDGNVSPWRGTAEEVEGNGKDSIILPQSIIRPSSVHPLEFKLKLTFYLLVSGSTIKFNSQRLSLSLAPWWSPSTSSSCTRTHLVLWTATILIPILINLHFK